MIASILATQTNARVDGDGVNAISDIGQRRHQSNDTQPNVNETIRSAGRISTPNAFPACENNDLENYDDNLFPNATISHVETPIPNGPVNIENTLMEPIEHGQFELDEILMQEPLQEPQSTEHHSNEFVDVQTNENGASHGKTSDIGSLQQTDVSITLVGTLSLERDENNFLARSKGGLDENTFDTPPYSPESMANGHLNDVRNIKINAACGLTRVVPFEHVLTSTPYPIDACTAGTSGIKRVYSEQDVVDKAVPAEKTAQTKVAKKIKFTVFKCDRCAFVSVDRKILAKHKNNH